jgi:hypothetical protein
MINSFTVGWACNIPNAYKGRIILRLILKKQGGGMWSGLMCLRIGTSGVMSPWIACKVGNILISSETTSFSRRSRLYWATMYGNAKHQPGLKR